MYVFSTLRTTTEIYIVGLSGSALGHYIDKRVHWAQRFVDGRDNRPTSIVPINDFLMIHCNSNLYGGVRCFCRFEKRWSNSD